MMVNVILHVFFYRMSLYVMLNKFNSTKLTKYSGGHFLNNAVLRKRVIKFINSDDLREQDDGAEYCFGMDN